LRSGRGARIAVFEILGAGKEPDAARAFRKGNTMAKHNAPLAFQFLAVPAVGRQAPHAAGPFTTELPARAMFADWQISAHAALRLTQHQRGTTELLCLGTIIDPRVPTATDDDLVERLLEIESFAELEAALAVLGGRWLLLVSFSGQSRIYTDAGALRTCFYATTRIGLCFVSQPTLVAAVDGTKPDGDPREGLRRSARADAYPLGVTPYEGIKQLLPNHFLDLLTAQPRRYWPLQSIPTKTRDEAARGIVDLLRGSIDALARRGKRLALPLTGGYDSRVLLAAAWDKRHEIDFFTVVDMATPAHDFVLPLRLAHAFGLKHSFFRAGDTTEAQIELLVRNTGGVWRDPNEHRVPAFGKSDADIVLLGNVSEVIRAGFYEYGDYPEHVDAALLARLSGWSDDPLAISACAAWLRDVPADTNVHLLDLYYWEERVGVWAALDSMATDAFIEVISPYNCRELLTIGLGVPLRDRCVVGGAPEESCSLYRRVCEVAAPETLTLPFNDGWLGRVVPLLRSGLPTPLRRFLKRLRQVARGLPRAGVLLLAWQVSETVMQARW